MAQRKSTLVYRLSRPFERFFQIEAASAALLFAMGVAALVWANSPAGETYELFWHVPLALSVGGWTLELSLGHLVNDALMAIFFFAVGMEIKRELVRGELSTRARAMLPLAGALGGMVVPALIYTAFHAGGPALRGWGIPMATDIAFAVAALSLLGSRVPAGLKVFLLALAIADDLGAVTVIAVFYTDDLSLPHLGWALAGLALVYAMNVAGVRAFAAYWVAGGVVWYLTFQSGVHPTVAGVFLGLITPARPLEPDQETLVDHGRQALERIRELLNVGEDDHGRARHRMARELQVVGVDSLSPLDFLVNQLDRWVAFGIMPVFALANAGVILDASTLANPSTQKVALAVALGLLIGKPVGIGLFSWLAVRTGLAEMPRGVNWTALVGSGVVAGIGFTVALFITNLAFVEAQLVAGAKIGILAGSAAATVIGLVVLSAALGRPDPR